MGFYFDGSGQRTHRHEPDDLDREDIRPHRPSPGKSSRTHGGGAVRGVPGKISLTMRLVQRIDRYARAGYPATSDERAREMVAQALESTGQPLPEPLRRTLEAHAGTDLSEVRVHTGAASGEAARALAAEAFTVDRDIHFATGAYDPDSARGRRLLAHEVAHTIQQRGLPRVELEQAAISQPDQAHERHADEFAGLFERARNEPGEQEGDLPEATRARMEHAFGRSFADVRLHPDSPRASGRALAVTEGRDIYFAPSRYAPGTERGDWLIGHELTHVVQQTGGNAGPQGQGHALEAEANAGADAVMTGRRAVVQMRAPAGASQAHEDGDDASIHGTPVGTQGIVSHRDGVNLRDRPLPGSGSSVLRRLPFNTALYVDTETSDGWYHVTLSTGEFGYVVKTHVNANVPEPTARLHEIASGETAIGIAERYYGSQVEWGEDLRFYVNVLEFVNRGPGARGIYKQNPDDAWEATRAREGYLIWIPGVAFARSLKGQVKSGSLTNDAWNAVKGAAIAAGEFLLGGGALIAGLLHGALESLWDILVGLKDLGVLAWNVLKSVFTGSVLSDAKALYDQVAALDLGALVAGWIDDFEKKWNDAGIMKRWHFRGWVIGYAIMEIVLLVASFGAVTGAKWAGKAAKLAKAITSLPRVQQTIKAVKSVKVPPELKKGLDRVFRTGDKAGDVARARQSLLSRLSPEAKLAVEALPEDQIARIARLHDTSPDAVDNILRGYYHKVVKEGGDVSGAAKYVDDSLAAMRLTQSRGFPYGFADLARFEEFKAKIVTTLRRYGLPHDDVAVHGSSVIRKTPHDIDVAVLVDRARFDEIVRGIQTSTDKAKILKQLRTEAAKGKIPSFLFERKFPGSSFATEIYGAADAMKVQVSIILKGGAFDIGPYIKF